MKRTMLASAVSTFAGLWPWCAVAQIGPNNIITTVAGAAWTFPGDGKPAKSAPISQVRSLNTDPNGNIIFADPGNHVVSRLNADGTITVLAGNGVRGFSGEDGPAREPVASHRVDRVLRAGRVVLAARRKEDADRVAVEVDEADAEVRRQARHRLRCRSQELTGRSTQTQLRPFSGHAAAFRSTSSTRSPSHSNPRDSIASTRPGRTIST